MSEDQIVQMSLAAQLLAHQIFKTDDINSKDFDKELDKQIEIAQKVSLKLYQKYAGI